MSVLISSLKVLQSVLIEVHEIRLGIHLENKMLSVRWLPSPIRSGIPCLRALTGLPPGALKLLIALCT